MKFVKTSRPAHYSQAEWYRAWADKLFRRASSITIVQSGGRMNYKYDWMRMRRGDGRTG